MDIKEKFDEWLIKFWLEEGKRFTYGTMALGMALGFYQIPELRDTGKSILIGIAMMLFNRVRGTKE